MKNQLTHHKIEKPNIYYRNLFRYCLIIIFIFSFLLPPNYTSLDIISFEDIHQSSNINSITWPMNKSVEEQIYSNFFKNCTLFENSGQNIYKASTATGDFIFQSRKINLIPYSNEEINLFSMKGQLNQFNISTIDNESLNSIDVEKNIIKSINFTFIDSYNIEPRGINEISGFINEYYGKNIDNWKENIKIFDKIEYKNLYNNIDLEYKIINGSLKYSFFLVRPSNYQQIKIHIDGHKNLYIDGNGNLHIGLSFYEMIEKQPVAFYRDNNNEYIRCNFKIYNDNEYGFELLSYNKNRPIVIDPMIFSTYLGGNDFDFGQSITVDNSGNCYIVGTTRSLDFPTTSNGSSSINHGSKDIFVSKIKAGGSALLFSTYIGGNGEDNGLSIILDNNGNILITGITNSDDFPTTKGVIKENKTRGQNNYDAFICKLTADSGSIYFSTLIGGETTDRGMDISTDALDQIYITGKTMSLDYPVTTDFINNKQKYYDGFLTVLNSNGTKIIYSTFIGGNENDTGISIDVQDNGTAFIIGETASVDFPTTENAIFEGKKGNLDIFLLAFNIINKKLLLSTYLGGSLDDTGNDIVFDGINCLYCVGESESEDFPITENAIQINKERFSDLILFIVEISNQPILKYSTYLGGSDIDLGFGIAVDLLGNIYIVGTTGSADFPTTNNAFQQKHTESRYDAFIIKMRIEDNTIFYSSFIGGNKDDYAYGIGIDSKGTLFIVGVTESDDFPVSLNAIQISYKGLETDAFVFALNPSENENPPQANAGPNNIIDQHEIFLFNGSGSSDNGTIIDWLWQFKYNDKIIRLFGEKVNFRFDISGEYHVDLIVTDNDFLQDIDGTIIFVRDIEKPIPRIRVNESANQGEMIFLDASLSSDNIGIVNYSWLIENNDSISDYSGKIVAFTPIYSGNYIIILNITDKAGNEASSNVTIMVRDKTAPIADAGYDVIVKSGTFVRLNGSKSTDNTGIIEWKWSFIYEDNPIILNGTDTGFIFFKLGTYEITLQVKDYSGNEGKDAIKITVIPEKKSSSDGTNLIFFIIILIITIIILYFFIRSKKFRR